LPPQPPALVPGLKQSAKKVVIAVLNLLVVDDDCVDLMTVKRGLLKAGIAHRIAEAKDGVEALAVLRGCEMPTGRRLVLLDLKMPRMSGLEFLRVLRADPELASTPVVIISTSGQEQDRREAHRLNVAGYFVKSLDFSSFVELLTIIDRYWSAVQYL
jgi:CheY-like chemotaxis protein